MGKLEGLTNELGEALRECKKQQIVSIARILCPEATNMSFKGIQDALSERLPEVLGGSVFSSLLYQGGFLDNQLSSRTPAVIQALKGAIASQQDPEIKEMWQSIFDAIKWEYLQKPTPETLNRWKQELLETRIDSLDSTNLPTPQALTHSPVVSTPPNFTPPTPSLVGASFQMPRDAVILNAGDTTVIIAPGPGQEVSIVRKSDGSTQINLRNEPS